MASDPAFGVPTRFIPLLRFPSVHAAAPSVKFLATALVVGGLLLAYFGSTRGWFGSRSGPLQGIDDVRLVHEVAPVSVPPHPSFAAANGSALGIVDDVVDGKILSVDLLARNLTVAVGEAVRVIHVGTEVTIRCGGGTIDFGRLQPRLRLMFAFAGSWRLAKLLAIDVDPRTL